MIDDATLDDQLIKILKRIDVVLEKAEGPMIPKKESGLPSIWQPAKKKADVIAFQQRLEKIILRNPQLSTAELIKISGAAACTIRDTSGE